jgi:hypothetical protein
MPRHAEARAVARASGFDRAGEHLISPEITLAEPSRQGASTAPIKKIPTGVRGLAAPLPDRRTFNTKKRSRRRAWLAQIGRRDDKWMVARSIINGVRLYDRGLTLDFLATDTCFSNQQVLAALYELRHGGHLGWSRRGPIFYFNPKMRAMARP